MVVVPRWSPISARLHVMSQRVSLHESQEQAHQCSKTLRLRINRNTVYCPRRRARTNSQSRSPSPDSSTLRQYSDVFRENGYTTKQAHGIDTDQCFDRTKIRAFQTGSIWLLLPLTNNQAAARAVAVVIEIPIHNLNPQGLPDLMQTQQ